MTDSQALASAAEGHHDRIEQLLSAMSREEKLAQLQIRYHPDPERAKELVRGGIGSVFWPGNVPQTNELQRIAREETAHGIPLLMGLDVIHGIRTIFPIPLASAASFDPAVAETDARVSAEEARSGGINLTFAPMIDVSRDPRWGRVAEGFGEDTYLTTVLGTAKVRGYQGESLAAPTSIAACAKHFVAYGQGEGGRDYNAVDTSWYRLRNVYLEPFRAVVEAGVGSVMASLNSVSGRPMHANPELLTGVLKEEWGFDGPVVGDADAVLNLVNHGVAEDEHDALVLSLASGLDIEMGGHVVAADGTTSILPGELTDERIDDAVRRVLQLKVRLGLFENPYVDAAAELDAPTQQSRSAALRAAERSIVLLKNEGGLLPVKPAQRKVLVVGPYADSTDHNGAWVMSFGFETTSTINAALRDLLPDSEITSCEGATFFGSNPALQEEARAAAADKDFIIVTVGEPSALSGEASSRSDLRLPGDQEALIHAIADTGVPFAVVLANGRPLVTSDWIARAPAVLEAWHLGTEAPAAIANVLSGAVNPAGRLPMSFPRASGQIPIYYDHENTGRPASVGGTLDQEEIDIGVVGPNNLDDRFTSKYRDLELGPEFEFGHGLSYTDFQHAELTVEPRSLALDALRDGELFTVSVAVSNIGDRQGDEVVQLYVRDAVATLARPVRQLRGFSRVALEAGASENVTFSVGWEDLGFWHGTERDGDFAAEPGTFELHVGPRLDATTELTVEVTR
ncbi:glycosyl hydrolase [Pseudoclavibacter sp. AY1F1]|uniref:glycoside hydrolase family 3 N-terminal domain-containing protein n=1 Tax=Pseudoclavibacter sp. AY1F1 TaxID=2080583 RepID=UPI000CE84258|nr:glycoside hydrolase family 3 N-terminal domain-containing protein [Pseudoclavibacter sp. AY1F1]PPF43333.1 glycosyl hydrolase [Pseudoclavibacter sp. AY1F1]